MKYLFIESKLYPAQFENFLEVVSEYCTTFSLVWRDSFKFNENAKQIEKDLRPFLIKEEVTSKWPGTEIFKAMATVRYYKFNNDSKKILRKNPDFYKWLVPDYPEDLAFYSKKGECWFASVAHENMAFFTNSSLTVSVIKDKIPGIEIKIENFKDAF